MPQRFSIQRNEGTASRRTIFMYVTGSDYLTPSIGAASAKAYLSKNGAASAASTNTPTAVDNTNMAGWYKLELTATEVNTLGELVVAMNSPGTGRAVCTIVEFDPISEGAIKPGSTGGRAWYNA